jgi:hypothetical protein
MGKKTQNKGDIGVTQVIANLVKHGYHVFIPISEHLPFDIIIINDKGVMKRIQVKYRKKSEGKVIIKLANTYSNSQGCYLIAHRLDLIDAYAIFCPDNEEIYYIKPSEIKAKVELRLRIDSPTIKQNNNKFLWAKNYTNISRIFIDE